jgi:hypothetical protein
MPLASLRAVYEGPGRMGPHGALPRDSDGLWDMDTTLRLISGIRITAEREPGEVLEYLNSLEKRFVLRGRLRRQLTGLIKSLSPPKLGRHVIYASDPRATHRVLIYCFYGRQISKTRGRYSPEYEEAGAYHQPIPDSFLYEPVPFKTVPLAKVDVRVPLKYLAGRIEDIEGYREAVDRYAEKLARLWFKRFSGGLDPVASGWAASCLERLTNRDRKQQEVWKMGSTHIGSVPFNGTNNTAQAFSLKRGLSTRLSNGGE